MSPPRRGSRQGRGRSTSDAGARRYPRTARVNRLLLEVLAETLERLVAGDERLSMLTVTAVDADADFATATVFFSSLDDEELEALGDARVRLQAEIGRQVRLKRTPLLRFAADPAVASGRRVEEILRELDLGDADSADGDAGAGETTATGEADGGEAGGGPSPGWP
jgi:ribosome-binding factor A